MIRKLDQGFKPGLSDVARGRLSQRFRLGASEPAPHHAPPAISKPFSLGGVASEVCAPAALCGFDDAGAKCVSVLPPVHLCSRCECEALVCPRGLGHILPS